jgi:ureidoacrylate peracid hydrolase
MHKSQIPAAALERIGQRKLKPIVIDPRRTAHVVIDLQVGFVAPGSLAEVPFTREMIDDVNAISDAVRAGGGLNVFVRFTVDPDEPLKWKSFFERMPDDMQAAYAEAFKVNGPAWPLWPGLDVREGDEIVDKTRLSAFIPGTCNLHDMLVRRGIDTIILTGTLTNACCESTARDAMQMGYKVLFVQDANATWDDETHNATLANMAMIFAEVVTADNAVQRVREAALQPVAA